MDATVPQTPSQPIPVSKKDYDSSELRTIDQINHLPEEDRAEVQTILEHLYDEWRDCQKSTRSYRESRRAFGAKLSRLHARLAKPGRQGLFGRCLDLKHIPRSTAYDILKDYNRTKGFPEAIFEAADDCNIDITAKRYKRASEELLQRCAGAEGLTKQEAMLLIGELREKAARRRRAPRDLFDGIEEDEQVVRIVDALIRETAGMPDNQKVRRVKTAVDHWERYFLGATAPFTLIDDEDSEPEMTN